jgi:beta-phosphoglucomutase family hydrolase
VKELKIHPKAKALIFDLDGTVADTMPVHYLAYKNILREFGIEFTPELFVSLAGIPAVGTIRKLNEIFGTSMDPEDIGHFKEREYEKIMNRMKPVEPVVKIVKKYHNVMPMAVGTGGYRRLAWKSLEILGLKQYFDILVASEDVTHPKPHPETFLLCAERMGVAPEFCHVFEDGVLGIEAATAAGMISTLVTDYYQVTIGKDIQPFSE